MTTREREAVVRGCLACSIDDHHACAGAVEDDAGGWSTVYWCCGLAVDPKTTAARSLWRANPLAGIGVTRRCRPGGREVPCCRRHQQQHNHSDAHHQEEDRRRNSPDISEGRLPGSGR